MPESFNKVLKALIFEQIATLPWLIASNIVMPKLSDLLFGAMYIPTLLIIDFLSISDGLIWYITDLLSVFLLVTAINLNFDS